MSKTFLFNTISDLYDAGCTFYAEWTILSNNAKKCNSMTYYRYIDAICTAMYKLAHEYDELVDDEQIQAYMRHIAQRATEIYFYGQ